MKMYNVVEFGAIPDSDKDQTKYIQNALDTAFLAGGGEVVIPSGAYKIKSLRIRSNTTLHLMENVCLKASRNPEDYFILKNDKIEPISEEEQYEGPWKDEFGKPNNMNVFGSRWNNGVIRIYKAKNVKVIGEKNSVIDGQNSYDEMGESHYRGCHGFSVLVSENIELSGYTVQHSGNWAHSFNMCKNILVKNVTCFAGHDGVHFRTCEDIVVSKCNFYTGDDSIAGVNNKNVTVSECEINSACSAFRFSGTNVLIYGCNIFAPAKYFFRYHMTKEEKIAGIVSNDSPSVQKNMRNNMLSVFTYYGLIGIDTYNLGTNIVMRNCTVDGADRFLHFNYSGNEPWQKNKPLLDIKMENNVVKNISMPIVAYGDAETPVSVEIANTDFTYRKGYENTDFMHTANYKNIIIKNVNLINNTSDTFIKTWSDEGNIEISDVKCSCAESDLVKRATEEFFAQWF